MFDILARLSHCSSDGSTVELLAAAHGCDDDSDLNFLCFDGCPSPALQVRSKTLSEATTVARTHRCMGIRRVYCPNHLEAFEKWTT